MWQIWVCSEQLSWKLEERKGKEYLFSILSRSLSMVGRFPQSAGPSGFLGGLVIYVIIRELDLPDVILVGYRACTISLHWTLFFAIFSSSPHVLRMSCLHFIGAPCHDHSGGVFSLLPQGSPNPFPFSLWLLPLLVQFLPTFPRSRWHLVKRCMLGIWRQ